MTVTTRAELVDIEATGAERSRKRVVEGLVRDFGPACMNAWNKPSVVELMLNPDGKVWVEEHGQGMYFSGFVMPQSQAMKLMTSMATILGTNVSAAMPILEGEMPDEMGGGRFEGVVAPIVRRPAFAIRKPAAQVKTLDTYAVDGVLSFKDDPVNIPRFKAGNFAKSVKGWKHRDVLAEAVRTRKNILVVGSTGSGKTTLVNAVLHEVATVTPDNRIVLLEDTNEIKCLAANYVTMRSAADIDFIRLLRVTMRMRPDRIIVGEVRGPEALGLLKCWNTGHPGGLATIHAGSAEEGMTRLQSLVAEATYGVDPHWIASMVDVVMFIDKEPSLEAGRKIREVAVVEGFDTHANRYLLTQI